MEKILLFQMADDVRKEIETIASHMRIKAEYVAVTEYKRTLGSIAENTTQNAAIQAVVNQSAVIDEQQGQGVLTKEHPAIPKESMLVFCGVTEKHLNKMLFEMRTRKLPVTYKSVLTETNKDWNVLKMYGEMERERLAYLLGGRRN